MVGEAFAKTITGTNQTQCEMSAFESSVNITVKNKFFSVF